MVSPSSMPKFDLPPLEILHQILKGTMISTGMYVAMALPSRFDLTASNVWRLAMLHTRFFNNNILEKHKVEESSSKHANARAAGLFLHQPS